MKRMKVILNLLLISLLISGSYGTVALLVYRGGWYGGNVLIPFIVYIPVLCIVLFHHFYIRKRIKALWQQYLIAIGLFLLVFYFLSFPDDNYIVFSDLLFLRFFLVVFAISMQWLDMLLFTEVASKNGLSRFMKFFITILAMIFFLDVYISISNFVKGIYADNAPLLQDSIFSFFHLFIFLFGFFSPYWDIIILY